MKLARRNVVTAVHGSLLLAACSGPAGTAPQPLGEVAEAGLDSGTPGRDAGDERPLGPDAADAADAAAPVGTPLSLDPQAAFEAETQIAVAPDGTIGVVWMAFPVGRPAIRLGYRFSTDGGKTFTPIAYLALPNDLAASDPAITVAADGTFYVSTLGMHLMSGDAGLGVDYMRVFVAAAPKGTSAFQAPVEVTGATQPPVFRDHPKIFAAAGGSVVVGYMESPSSSLSPMSGVVATSADGGKTWSRVALAAPTYLADFFWFCEGAGVVYVTYLEATDSGYFVALQSSATGGATWAAGLPVSLPSEIPADQDPTCVASGNDVWIAYGTTTMAPPPNSWETSMDPAHAWTRSTRRRAPSRFCRC